MDVLSNNPALSLGAVNLVYTTGILVYVQSKTNALTEDIEKLQKNDKTPYGKNQIVENSLNDLYERIEHLELENNLLKDRTSRLECLMNSILSNLSIRGININIDTKDRRCIKNHQVPVQTSVQTPVQTNHVRQAPIQQKKPSIQEIIDEHESDEDVISIIQKAKNQN